MVRLVQEELLFLCELFGEKLQSLKRAILHVKEVFFSLLFMSAFFSKDQNTDPFKYSFSGKEGKKVLAYTFAFFTRQKK